MKRFVALLLALLMLCLLLRADVTMTAASAACRLFVTAVLPGLFPYMVISSTIVSLGLLDPICRFIPTHRILRLPQSSAPIR